ncbi:uncharacterized protein LOC134494768 [Candoia aspera]|uniref:uncharacterized protein LOC134494768 n=1 Tax=Candoia aspera TaxID=51853 RepID=UPI002FD84EA8
MAPPPPPGREGRRLSHLRSTGSRALVSGGGNVIHFFKAVTLFGRNSGVVDYCLSSSAAITIDLKYISRIHARVIRTPSAYILMDSSLSGVYINDIRINGRLVLQEGDTVTFGHPTGKNLPLGSHTQQPNSPFYFLVRLFFSLRVVFLPLCELLGKAQTCPQNRGRGEHLSVHREHCANCALQAAWSIGRSGARGRCPKAGPPSTVPR